MFKIALLTLFLSSFLLALSGEDVQKPQVAVKKVLSVFKESVRGPVTKMNVKIPYNVNYSVTKGSKSYYVSEYKVRILFKTDKTQGLYTDEKDYIVRFIVDANADKVVDEEIYSLIEEKEPK